MRRRRQPNGPPPLIETDMLQRCTHSGVPISGGRSLRRVAGKGRHASQPDARTTSTQRRPVHAPSGVNRTGRVGPCDLEQFGRRELRMPAPDNCTESCARPPPPNVLRPPARGGSYALTPGLR